jgi:hypothetical protein
MSSTSYYPRCGLRKLGERSFEWCMDLVEKYFGSFILVVVQQMVGAKAPLDFWGAGKFVWTMKHRVSVINFLDFIGVDLHVVLHEHVLRMDTRHFIAVAKHETRRNLSDFHGRLFVVNHVGALCGERAACALYELWILKRTSYNDLRIFYDFLHLRFGCYANISAVQHDFKSELYLKELSFYNL